VLKKETSPHVQPLPKTKQGEKQKHRQHMRDEIATVRFHFVTGEQSLFFGRGE